MSRRPEPKSWSWEDLSYDMRGLTWLFLNKPDAGRNRAVPLLILLGAMVAVAFTALVFVMLTISGNILS